MPGLNESCLIRGCTDCVQAGVANVPHVHMALTPEIPYNESKHGWRTQTIHVPLVGAVTEKRQLGQEWDKASSLRSPLQNPWSPPQRDVSGSRLLGVLPGRTERKGGRVFFLCSEL